MVSGANATKHYTETIQKYCDCDCDDISPTACPDKYVTRRPTLVTAVTATST